MCPRRWSSATCCRGLCGLQPRLRSAAQQHLPPSQFSLRQVQVDVVRDLAPAAHHYKLHLQPPAALRRQWSQTGRGVRARRVAMRKPAAVQQLRQAN